MRRHPIRGFVFACLILPWAAVMAVPAPARADDNDIVLSRLGTEAGTGQVIGDNLGFRSMASELGVVFAPRLLAPADTLGFGGFQFTADLGFSTISHDAAYWRVLQSSPDPTGVMPGVSHGNGVMTTMGLFMRKGIWLPLPSFEIGAGAVNMLGSDLWGGQVYAKLGLHEGYHDLPLPSLAIRGAASRVMGSREVDLTVASVDVSLSKAIGIAGSVNFEPYAGYNLLLIVPRSEVIDKTPHIADDRGLHFVLAHQDDIVRQRIFTGFKLQYYVFALLLEANIAMAGSSVDDRGTGVECTGVNPATANCDATDQAKLQQTYTLAVGLDF
jgi:hypothetical protein